MKGKKKKKRAVVRREVDGDDSYVLPSRPKVKAKAWWLIPRIAMPSSSLVLSKSTRGLGVARKTSCVISSYPTPQSHAGTEAGEDELSNLMSYIYTNDMKREQ